MADAEDLEATATAGYKVGEKKTIQELATLDNNDGTYRLIQNHSKNGRSRWDWLQVLGLPVGATQERLSWFHFHWRSREGKFQHFEDLCCSRS